MTAERKKQIYEVCCKYDVIIAEDDPYFFLQGKTTSFVIPMKRNSIIALAGQYRVPEIREMSKSRKEPTDQQFIDSLVPSYLKFDREGRVFRIDTFSSESRLLISL